MADFKLKTEEMIKAGLHFGHRISAVHPKMKPYISTIRNSVHIIDLEKTVESFTKALEFIKKLVADGKVLMLVGTKIQIKDLLEETAQQCSLPYVSERWLGGTFTNFPIILKRIEHLKELERKKESGEWEKYTKKERIKLEEEIKRLDLKFRGLRTLSRLPDAVFVCDLGKDKLAVKEARMKGIRVIGICDTNTDPSLADFPIPANDDAVSSVKYILDKVKEAIMSQK